LTGTARGTTLIEVSKRQKLLADCRNNPRGVPFSQFLTLIKALGFVHDRTSGSHLIFVHPDARVPLVNVQPSKDSMAKPYQVRQALDLVDTYGLKVQS
jgi:predicted RNA binding protein YcfA (HicA-like mRNA interferase family)